MNYAFAASADEHASAPGVSDEPERKFARFSLAVPQGASNEFRFGYNVSPALGFGLHGQGRFEHDAVVSRDAFRAPHLSFAEEGYNASASLKGRKAWDDSRRFILGRLAGQRHRGRLWHGGRSQPDDRRG